MCEGGGRGGKKDGCAFYYTYIYIGKREDCKGAKLVGVLVAETIHPACVCVREEDTEGREADTTSNLKMLLENGGSDKRVSRGQSIERAVCVCETVSVEKGARSPPLPAAVVCPPGGRRRGASP
jgi:hypothetical protein